MFPPDPDIIFHIATGESIPFTVWQDRNSNVKLVKCDICGMFMPLSGAKQSITALKKHRGDKTFDKAAKKNLSMPFTFINNFPDVGPSTTTVLFRSIRPKVGIFAFSKNLRKSEKSRKN
jgi:hypothetical protein